MSIKLEMSGNVYTGVAKDLLIQGYVAAFIKKAMTHKSALRKLAQRVEEIRRERRSEGYGSELDSLSTTLIELSTQRTWQAAVTDDRFGSASRLGIKIQNALADAEGAFDPKIYGIQYDGLLGWLEAVLRRLADLASAIKLSIITITRCFNVALSVAKDRAIQGKRYFLNKYPVFEDIAALHGRGNFFAAWYFIRLEDGKVYLIGPGR